MSNAGLLLAPAEGFGQGFFCPLVKKRAFHTVCAYFRQFLVLGLTFMIVSSNLSNFEKKIQKFKQKSIRYLKNHFFTKSPKSLKKNFSKEKFSSFLDISNTRFDQRSKVKPNSVKKIQKKSQKITLTRDWTLSVTEKDGGRRTCLL